MQWEAIQPYSRQIGSFRIYGECMYPDVLQPLTQVITWVITWVMSQQSHGLIHESQHRSQLCDQNLDWFRVGWWVITRKESSHQLKASLSKTSQLPIPKKLLKRFFLNPPQPCLLEPTHHVCYRPSECKLPQGLGNGEKTKPENMRAHTCIHGRPTSYSDSSCFKS